MGAANVPGVEQAEIAHVLMVDVVGYTLLPLEEQARLVKELQEMLRETAEFKRAEADHDLICAGTGDGAALVFFRGPVRRGRDINGVENVAGAGINTAQRVMDSGDGGHILLSASAADFLLQMGGWDESLHDLGECTVKHGKLLHLYNLCTEDAGNP